MGLAVADGQRDALEDLLGAVLGVDRDVQVLDLQGAHAGVTPFRVVVDVDVDVVAVVPRRGRSATGSVAGQAGGLAGAQVEARAVQPALDVQSVDLALAERDGGVGADVLDGEDLVAVAGDGDVVAADVDAERLVRRRTSSSAQARSKRHQPARPPRTFLASSASTVATSCSSSSGTSILRIRSLKKPCTTRRRASSSAMPRERR